MPKIPLIRLGELDLFSQKIDYLLVTIKNLPMCIVVRYSRSGDDLDVLAGSFVVNFFWDIKFSTNGSQSISMLILISGYGNKIESIKNLKKIPYSVFVRFKQLVLGDILVS